MSTLALIVVIALAVKHFLADGPFQYPYMYLNKGKWLHPGGLFHALVHGAGTFVIAIVLGILGHITVVEAVMVLYIDVISHYVIDYIKASNPVGARRVEHMALSESGLPTEEKVTGLLITSDSYFYALIGDQVAHFMVYAVIAYVLANGS